jgi:hypothetical protein
MTIRTTSRLAAPFVAMAALLVPDAAPAQMTPLIDNRQTFAEASLLGNTVTLAEQPAAPFAYFESYLDALAENPDPNGGGSCQAFAFQISQFFPAGISMSGGTSGSFSVHEGQYSGHSLASFRFRVDTCVQYQLDAWLDYGDFPLPSAGHVQLTGPTLQTMYHDLTSTGEIHTTGRLAPGEYRLEGRSGFGVGAELESVTGPTYTAIWTCVPCATSLVAGQPSDLDVACGATAVFTVTADPRAGPVTYQWRRNLVPLANSSHISGADTQTLSIDNACHADSGYYDVVLSNGTIVEPSRPARLGITTTTAVEGALEGPQRTFTLLAAGPNPFQRGTSFRYAVGSPRHVRIAIYDVAGERVRTLADGVLAGWGTVTWDGRSAIGSQMPAGIYFLRAESGSFSESRRLVLIK